MALRIRKPGLQSTIQDLGRPGFQDAGVPVSGAMDRFSMQVANMLCGNPPGAPVIEAIWHGAQWMTESDLLMACCGGGARLNIDGTAVPFGRPVFVPAQSLLTLEPASHGFYTYIAVAGGFHCDFHMGSASTYVPSMLGGNGGNPLQAGQLLETAKEKTALSRRIESSLKKEPQRLSYPAWGIEQDPEIMDYTIIRATEGPEQAWIGAVGLHTFWTEEFSISPRSNRMGSRLTGSSIPVQAMGELLSTAVTSGTVQVTHDGTLMILMADAQTTGGYPRIAQVAAVDLSKCAQLRPGGRFRFRQISGEEAEELYLDQERKLRQLQRSITLRYGI